MKRIVRLTESDLTRIVRRVIMEQATATYPIILDKVRAVVAMGKTKNQNNIPFIKMEDRKQGTMKFAIDCSNENFAKYTTDPKDQSKIVTTYIRTKLTDAGYPENVVTQVRTLCKS